MSASWLHGMELNGFWWKPQPIHGIPPLRRKSTTTTTATTTTTTTLTMEEKSECKDVFKCYGFDCRVIVAQQNCSSFQRIECADFLASQIDLYFIFKWHMTYCGFRRIQAQRYYTMYMAYIYVCVCGLDDITHISWPQAELACTFSLHFSNFISLLAQNSI